MESSRTSETIYQPLPSPSSIRVLRLLPGPRGTRICCELETIELGPEQDVELYHDEPLEDTGPSSHVEVILGLGLQYEALSYVWGDASVTTIIEVEDKPFNATINLESALQHLRYSDRPRVLWADAICIYSHRTATKDLGTLRFAPQFSEGFNFTYLVN
jgi:hypothetical protein